MLDQKIEKIIEIVEINESGPIFTDAAKEEIKAAAVMAKETGIYKREAEKYPERFKTGKAGDLYIEMLSKIVDAPTRMHMLAVPRLMLPAISDALEREENENGKFGCDV